MPPPPRPQFRAPRIQGTSAWLLLGQMSWIIGLGALLVLCVAFAYAPHWPGALILLPMALVGVGILGCAVAGLVVGLTRKETWVVPHAIGGSLMGMLLLLVVCIVGVVGVIRDEQQRQLANRPLPPRQLPNFRPPLVPRPGDPVNPFNPVDPAEPPKEPPELEMKAYSAAVSPFADRAVPSQLKLEGDHSRAPGLLLAAVKSEDPVVDALWSDDGESLYLLTDRTLRRVATQGWRVERELRITGGTQLVFSAQGLLIARSGQGAVAIVDPKTLDGKMQVSVPGLRAIASAASRNELVATTDRDTIEVIHPISRAALSAQVRGVRLVAMPPKGDLLYAASDRIAKYKVTASGKLRPAGETFELSSGDPRRLELSADGAQVALVCSSGNRVDRRIGGRAADFSTLVFSTDNLAGHFNVVRGGASPTALAFDPKSPERVYAQNSGHVLLVFDGFHGEPSLKLPATTEQRVVKLAPHPTGAGVLVVSTAGMTWVTRPPGGGTGLVGQLAVASKQPLQAGSPVLESLPKGSHAIQPHFAEGNRITPVPFGKADIDLVAPPQWSNDGKHLYVLERTGKFHKVAVDGWRDEWVLQMPADCKQLEMCSAGPVVVHFHSKCFWVIDPDGVKTRAVSINDWKWVAAARNAPRVFVGGAERLHVYDLGAGERTEYDVSSRTVRDALGHHGPWVFERIERVAVSADGNTAFVASRSGGTVYRLKFTPQHMGVEEWAVEPEGHETAALRLSPDDSRLAAVFQGSSATRFHAMVRLCDTREPYVDTRFESDYARAIEFDATTGEIYTTSHGAAVAVFDASGSPGKTLKLGLQRPMVSALVRHPDGKKLLVYDREGVLFVERSVAETPTVAAKTPGVPDPPKVVGKPEVGWQTTNDLTVSTATGYANSAYLGMPRNVRIVGSPVWADDGKSLFIAQNDGVVRQLSFPDFRRQRVMKPLSVQGEMMSRVHVAPASTGTVIASPAGDFRAIHPQTLALEPIENELRGIQRIAGSRQSPFLLVDDTFRKLSLLDTRDGTHTAFPPEGALSQPFQRIFAIGMSPDGQKVICAADKALYVFRVEDGKWKRTPGPEIADTRYMPTRISFSGDSTCWVPTGYMIKAFRVHRFDDPAPGPEITANRVRAIALDPKGTTIYGMDDRGDVHVWDADGKEQRKFHTATGQCELLVDPAGSGLLINDESTLVWHPSPK